jgi:hypothetical protein
VDVGHHVLFDLPEETRQQADAFATLAPMRIAGASSFAKLLR